MFKHPTKDSKIFLSRWCWCLLWVVISLLTLFARLYYLQVKDHQFYLSLAQKNHLTLASLVAKRGLIYDRNGVLLADNQAIFRMDIIPRQTDGLKDTIQRLGHFIQLDAQQIQSFYKRVGKQAAFHKIPLKLRLENQEVAEFIVNQENFPGVYLSSSLTRHYRYDDALAHIIGYVQSGVGKSGLEKRLNAWLRGKNGLKQTENNATGKMLHTQVHTLPTAGYDVYLSIDVKLQAFIHRIMKGLQGAVVVMNPRNGDILALVSHPSYHANPFVQGIDSNTLNMLQKRSDRPLFNRALNGQFPLGSLVKPFEAIVALDQDVIDVESTIYDPGYFQLPNSKHIYHDWNPRGHGWVNIRKALTESSDTFFYTVGTKLGINRLSCGLEKFGFGQATGMQFMQESAGLLPKRNWKQAALGEAWYPGDTVNTSIGQGYFLVTPLQLAYATSILANRGERITPRLILKMQSAEGQWYTQDIQKRDPLILKDRDTWETVIHALQAVISHPHGTGHRFGRVPYSIAAKTGTVQVVGRTYKWKLSDTLPKHLQNHSLLIAFSPTNKPKIVVATIIEHAPRAISITRCVMDYYLLGKSCL